MQSSDKLVIELMTSILSLGSLSFERLVEQFFMTFYYAMKNFLWQISSLMRNIDVVKSTGDFFRSVLVNGLWGKVWLLREFLRLEIIDIF